MAFNNVSAKGNVPVFDAVKYKQATRTIVVDGQKRIERRPIQKSIRMVDPSGNIAWLPLYGGPSQTGDTDPYKVSVEYAKRKAGWIPYGQCPQNGGYDIVSKLPDEVKNRRPCTAGKKGGEVSDLDPCTCVLEVIAARRVVNLERMEQLENAANRDKIKSVELQQQAIAEQREQTSLIAKALGKIADGKAAAK